MCHFDDGGTPGFTEKILAFYRDQGRRFPWRETENPYAILVSELMLQQTQTDRVSPRFESWLARFPTAESLAAASLAEALSEWSGLGYNRRARFLREACAEIAGRTLFSWTAAELEKLPGIGPYTARAVSCFAFGRPEVFIETNIRTVFLHRFFAGREGVQDREIMPLIEETLYRGNPRIWYYGLMDYGAFLKKSSPNPNRRSAHYTKQSAFRGSVREARGAVVRALTRGASPLGLIAAEEGIDPARLEKAAQALAAEGMIFAEPGGIYRFALK